MRITRLDPLAKEFFTNNFPGYNDTVTVNENNLLSNRVPFVDLDMDIDTESIIKIAKELAEEHTELHERKKYDSEDYKRVDKVSSLLLWSDGKKEGWISDIYYKKRAPNYPVKELTEKTRSIKDLLTKSGIDATLCWLHSLEPGGYFRPHRDIKLDSTPLDYFWIPLNDVPGSQLRSYPYGEISTKVGKAYLLNNDDYVHGVFNNGEETRYVLLGHIDHNINGAMKEMIKNKIIDRWCRHSDSN